VSNAGGLAGPPASSAEYDVVDNSGNLGVDRLRSSHRRAAPHHTETPPHVTSTRRAATVAAIALSSLVVAACGSSGGEDSKSANQILSDAQTALKSATSYHLVADVSSGGKSVKVDVKVDNKTTSAGHIEQDGVGFDYISVGGKLYIKGRELFAKFSPAAANIIGDQWVTATGNSGLEQAASSVTAFSDPTQLADNFTTKGTLVKGDVKTVNGQQVIAIKASDGELDIADTGTPYPLHLEGSTVGKVDLKEYGAHFGITAPAGALDASTLSQ
jgi:hypothetical protein